MVNKLAMFLYLGLVLKESTIKEVIDNIVCEC